LFGSAVGAVAILAAVAMGAGMLTGCQAPASSGGGGGTQGELTGSLQIKGSDTMVNLGQKWAETFMAKNPGVQLAVTGGGSGTGISALINGTTDLAQASRQIKDEEKADASKAGFEPKEFKVALDGLAVAVNPANGVSELSFKQLSDIFSGKITDWRDVGGKAGKIVVLSRESNSGTHVYFLEEVVQSEGKDLKYASTALLMPSSQAIVDEIAKNPGAIGYFGMGYLGDTVKALAIKKEDKDTAIKPSIADVQSGTYPISRGLYVYTKGEPQGPAKAYIDYLLSEDGQKVVEEMDFVPLGK
jgi:phosphate transport system substrate-binding protein